MQHTNAGPRAYYNENDSFAGEWLRGLSAAGHINAGAVDTRSIELLEASDVKDATQAHFFAGVGVWSHALRAAGWPDDVPVWTGSCPCQPFSVAGRRKGEDDARHLWPVWLELIKQCLPGALFGEQVASPAGRDWLASVSADLEALGYLVVAADLCAAGVGAPHLRQRLFFRAILKSALEHTIGDGGRRNPGAVLGEEGEGTSRREVPGGVADGVKPSGAVGALADASGERHDGKHALLRSQEKGRQRKGAVSETTRGGETSTLADADDVQRHRGGDAGSPGGLESPDGSGASFWSSAEWIECLDGKARPAEPSIFPLAHGPTQRMGRLRAGRLRAYGNAIVPQVATVFILSFLEALEDLCTKAI